MCVEANQSDSAPVPGNFFVFVSFVRASERSCVDGRGTGLTMLGGKNRKRAPRYREQKFTRFFTASKCRTVANFDFRSPHPCDSRKNEIRTALILDTIAKFGVSRCFRAPFFAIVTRILASDVFKAARSLEIYNASASRCL